MVLILIKCHKESSKSTYTVKIKVIDSALQKKLVYQRNASFWDSAATSSIANLTLEEELSSSAESK